MAACEGPSYSGTDGSIVLMTKSSCQQRKKSKRRVKGTFCGKVGQRGRGPACVRASLQSLPDTSVWNETRLRTGKCVWWSRSSVFKRKCSSRLLFDGTSCCLIIASGTRCPLASFFFLFLWSHSIRAALLTQGHGRQEVREFVQVGRSKHHHTPEFYFFLLWFSEEQLKDLQYIFL